MGRGIDGIDEMVDSRGAERSKKDSGNYGGQEGPKREREREGKGRASRQEDEKV